MAGLDPAIFGLGAEHSDPRLIGERAAAGAREWPGQARP